MSAAQDVANVLGVGMERASPLALVEAIERGLPVAALERVSSAIAPLDQSFKFRIVPKATFNRRKSKPPRLLSNVESDVLTRVARVWARACGVWGGEVEARAFLNRPHPLLDNRRPLDVVLGAELGAELVVDILGRLEHGSAA